MSNSTTIPLQSLRAMFYLVLPEESSKSTPKQVPNYIMDAVPWFFAMIAVEMVVATLKGKRTTRLNDGFSSLAAGYVQQVTELLCYGISMASYIWIFENMAPVKFDVNTTTWVVCFFAIDFGYYRKFIVTNKTKPLYSQAASVFHRYAHEVNIFWSTHQVHHSSEDYNLTTALRQSMLQSYCSWIFYLPAALAGIPPALFAAHKQFNTLYQFWIHTEMIDSLGPLEYILNTPSHHRVHHGRNRYCIDKNYAGTLIIWDRMFGTFAPESEEVVYGLVHPLASWDPLYTQFCHLQHILKTAWTTPGVSNKLACFWKGPGWHPGTPRMGLHYEIPDIKAPQPRYDKTVCTQMGLYVSVHFVCTVILGLIILQNDGLCPSAVLALSVYAIFALTCFGRLFDNKPTSPTWELIRCVLVVAADVLPSFFGYPNVFDYFRHVAPLMLLMDGWAVIQAIHYLSVLYIGLRIALNLPFFADEAKQVKKE